MKGKLLLLVGLGAGYVLGAKAGRKRYEEIKLVAGRVWNSEPVQKPLQSAEQFARTTAPELTDALVAATGKVVEGAKALVESLGAQASSVSAEAEERAAAFEAGEPAKKPAAKTSRTSASRSTAAKKPATRSTASKTSKG